MNNTLRHIGLLFFDILCIGILWIGYDDFRLTLLELEKHRDVIRFGSRAGFYIVGLGFPFLHLLIIMESICSNFISKYKKLINGCIVGLLATLLTLGFVGSSWLESQVERAGYVYCRNASGSSAISKTLVYTKDTIICEELVEERKNGRRVIER